MHWNDGYDVWWWMIPMMVVMVAVAAAVVWALVHATRPDQRASPKSPSPEDVLAHRLAGGEIDAAEYKERLDVLQGRASQSG